MNLYDFCLQLETLGILTDGVKVGAVSAQHATWFKLMKEFKAAKSKPGFNKTETLHELSVKHRISYDWAYRIVSKLS